MPFFIYILQYSKSFIRRHHNLLISLELGVELNFPWLQSTQSFLIHQPQPRHSKLLSKCPKLLYTTTTPLTAVPAVAVTFTISVPAQFLKSACKKIKMIYGLTPQL